MRGITNSSGGTFSNLHCRLNGPLTGLFWGQTRDPLRSDLGKTTRRRSGSSDQQTDLSAFPRDGAAREFPRARRIRACPRPGGSPHFPRMRTFSSNVYKSRAETVEFDLLRMYADHTCFDPVVFGSNILPGTLCQPQSLHPLLPEPWRAASKNLSMSSS